MPNIHLKFTISLIPYLVFLQHTTVHYELLVMM